MLGNKHWVSSKRRLLTVVRWVCWSEPPYDKVAGVVDDNRQGLLPQINTFPCLEMEAPSERRFFQGLKDVIDALHTLIIIIGGLSTSHRW